METLKEILEVMGLFIIVLGGLILGLAMIAGALSPHKPITEYELFGEEGADGYEQRMMGMSDEEYAEYNKKHQTNSAPSK